MRILIVATAACVLLAGAAEAKDMKACNVDWSAMKKAKTVGSQTHKLFMTTCLAEGASGGAQAPVAAPMVRSTMTPQPVGDAAVTAAKAPVVFGAMPSGATAKCKDGTYSMSKHHSGSCSHHGGVAQFVQ